MHEEHEGYCCFSPRKATSTARLRTLRKNFDSFLSDSDAAMLLLTLL